MPHYSPHLCKRTDQQRKRLLPEWLVYLPGAIIISYGLWLTLSL